MSNARTLASAVELIQAHTPFVLVTLLATRGHAPQDAGAKALVTAQGLREGTVGGGKLEAKAIAHARAMLDEGRRAPELVTWNLTRDVGMSCGGEATVYFEPMGHAWEIAVFGAGHVAQALTRTLIALECRVSCFDPRAEWVDRLPEARQLRRALSADLPGEVRAMPARAFRETFFVVMTQGHATDFPVLCAIFERARKLGLPPYVGVLGSSVKAIKIRSELKAQGFAEDVIARLHCPMGLPLGSNAPAEIALSIAAQLVQARDQRVAPSVPAPAGAAAPALGPAVRE